MKNTIKWKAIRRIAAMRGIAIIVILLACAGTIFAQEAKNALSLDLFPLFKGFLATDSDNDISFFCMAFSYERSVAPHFGIGVQLDVFPGKIPGGFDMNTGKVTTVDYMYFGMSLLARYYPLSSFDKFFLGANLGFNSQSIDGKTKPEDGGFTGPLIGLIAGYRLVSNFIYIEPSMSYVLAKAGDYPITPLGWQGGLRFGIAF